MLGHHTLKPQPGSKKKSKRLGRGNGSGSGNFSGRGMKGQKARSGKKIKAWFEGGQTPMMQRMPQKPGFRNPNKTIYQVINIDKIAKHFQSGNTVNNVELASKNLISKKNNPIKLLGVGEIDFAVDVHVNAASKTAIEKIEKAGGKVIVK